MNPKLFSTSTLRCGPTVLQSYLREGNQAVPSVERSLDQAGKNQTLVFVHSRKETAETVKLIRDMSMEKETIAKVIKADGATREISTEEANTVKDSNLRDLLSFDFGIHHVGMRREDRSLVEELFADRSVQVLVCTGTLA